jgi:hypothetical protein
MLLFIFHKPQKERTMERRLMIRIGLLASLLAMTALAGSAVAGGTQSGFEPPQGATIIGPELWGVFTIYCSADLTGATPNFATIRIKRVVDCNTEVLTFVDPAWSDDYCPVTEEGATEWGLGGTIQQTLASEWGTTGTPYIDTVKNFDQQGTGEDNDPQLTSFDGMIKFWTP